MRLMPAVLALLPLLPLSTLATAAASPETLRVERYTDDGNPGTLRWAIETSNRNPGHYRIDIAAVGKPPYVIRPSHALPEIKGPVSITGLAWARRVSTLPSTAPPTSRTRVFAPAPAPCPDRGQRHR
ncbi:parallel beta-helix repeat-containing protein [Pseudomonas putida]|nr:parallel beta-helix repeat-containing protein [Pseudomonas putida]